MFPFAPVFCGRVVAAAVFVSASVVTEAAVVETDVSPVSALPTGDEPHEVRAARRAIEAARAVVLFVFIL